MEAINPELKTALESIRARECSHASRTERAAFVAGYFFSRNPIALLGCWKK